MGGASAVTSALLLKIPLEQSFECWSFSKEEIARITPPLENCVRKYLPKVAKWGPESELAGNLLPILAGKVAAVIIAAKIFKASERVPAPAVRPSKPADVVSIRPPASAEAAEAATAPQRQTSTESSVSSPAASTKLPDAFAHNLVDKDADLLGAALS
ncbi:MAG: hypothetical protein ACYDAL_16385 [Candidatus Dormibacteraceae bacterium]